MKNIIICTVSAIVLAFLGTAVYAFGSTDYPSSISSQLTKAEEARNKAQALSCEYIGQLTSECYKRNSSSCSALQAEEQKYQDAFSAQAYQDCLPKLPQDSPQIMPTVDREGNSLFFGDEGMKK